VADEEVPAPYEGCLNTGLALAGLAVVLLVIFGLVKLVKFFWNL
jgi:hypothetical protein